MFDQWSPLNPHTVHMPNAADTALFQAALTDGPEHPALADIPRPRVAYIGKFDAYKVDFDLLRDLAGMCQDVHFVCVGPYHGIEHGVRPSVPRGPNFHYINTLPQRELPAILRGCGACIMPFRLNEYTQGVSPLKLYEYLAAGQPVVATALPALVASEADGLILVEPTAASFAAGVRQALAFAADDRRKISAQAQAHSWERRVDELHALILGRLAEKMPSSAMHSPTNPGERSGAHVNP